MPLFRAGEILVFLNNAILIFLNIYLGFNIRRSDTKLPPPEIHDDHPCHIVLYQGADYGIIQLQGQSERKTKLYMSLSGTIEIAQLSIA